MSVRTGEESTVNPELQVLMHAVSSCSGVAVQQLLKQNPSLVKEKGSYFLFFSLSYQLLSRYKCLTIKLEIHPFFLHFVRHLNRWA